LIHWASRQIARFRGTAAHLNKINDLAQQPGFLMVRREIECAA
jgi:hypothetical protein